MRIWLYFIVCNVLLVAITMWTLLPGRVASLQNQTTAMLSLNQQLILAEKTLQNIEENLALLTYLQVEDTNYTIQPKGKAGTVFTYVRNMLHLHNLLELEFYAGEQASLYIGSRYVSVIRTTIVAEGSIYDINGFLKDVANHYRYKEIERIQISTEFLQNRLLLTFSIYEEMMS